MLSARAGRRDVARRVRVELTEAQAREVEAAVRADLALSSQRRLLESALTLITLARSGAIDGVMLVLTLSEAQCLRDLCNEVLQDDERTRALFPSARFRDACHRAAARLAQAIIEEG